MPNDKASTTEQFRDLARRTRYGEVNMGDLRTLVEVAEKAESHAETASVLRFGIRIARIARLDPLICETALAASYREAASNAEPGSARRIALLRWTARYGQKCIDEKIEHEASTLLQEKLEESGPGLGTVAWCDAAGTRTLVDTYTGQIIAASTSGWKLVATINPSSQVQCRNLIGDVEGLMTATSLGWQACGRTHRCKPLPATNDDGIMICRSGERLLLAVADGTGDSEFGSRASSIALRRLSELVLLGVPISIAIQSAAAAVRIDNNLTQLDGATTLVCAVASPMEVELANVGDTVWMVGQGANNITLRGSEVTRDRTVLGGEPLGWTITSSGRRVWNLDGIDGVDERILHNVKIVVLGSDGLALRQGKWTSESLAKEPWNSSFSPSDMVERMITGALDGIKRGEKADNITALVAVRFDI